MNLKNKNNQMIISICLALFIVTLLSAVFVPDYTKYFIIGYLVICLPLSFFYKMEYQDEQELKRDIKRGDAKPFDQKGFNLIIAALVLVSIAYMFTMFSVPHEFRRIVTMVFLIIMMPIAFKGNQYWRLNKIHKNEK
ncbi:hypothetical protein [Macrococcus armenti]|uniref:hypothetical protein n=1 Tax=Macrococcus armenti TaxID=2875764 RepID=UPI001CCF0F38|nr:hypothetical protein [Macrococcus armenti]UBH08084.1 hypothetical protein LAU41_08640 [Macrococcus armenti]